VLSLAEGLGSVCGGCAGVMLGARVVLVSAGVFDFASVVWVSVGSGGWLSEVGGTAVGGFFPGGPVWVWFLSPWPQPGRSVVTGGGCVDWGAVAVWLGAALRVVSEGGGFRLAVGAGVGAGVGVGVVGGGVGVGGVLGIVGGGGGGGGGVWPSLGGAGERFCGLGAAGDVAGVSSGWCGSGGEASSRNGPGCLVTGRGGRAMTVGGAACCWVGGTMKRLGFDPSSRWSWPETASVPPTAASSASAWTERIPTHAVTAERRPPKCLPVD
jgi:hypothetical protein